MAQIAERVVEAENSRSRVEPTRKNPEVQNTRATPNFVDEGGGHAHSPRAESRADHRSRQGGSEGGSRPSPGDTAPAAYPPAPHASVLAAMHTHAMQHAPSLPLNAPSPLQNSGYLEEAFLFGKNASRGSFPPPAAADLPGGVLPSRRAPEQTSPPPASLRQGDNSHDPRPSPQQVGNQEIPGWTNLPPMQPAGLRAAQPPPLTVEDVRQAVARALREAGQEGVGVQPAFFSREGPHPAKARLAQAPKGGGKFHHFSPSPGPPPPLTLCPWAPEGEQRDGTPS